MGKHEGVKIRRCEGESIEKSSWSKIGINSNLGYMKINKE